MGRDNKTKRTADQTKLDFEGLSNELSNLTSAEVQQLQNIGTSTISSAQWTILGTIQTLSNSKLLGTDGTGQIESKDADSFVAGGDGITIDDDGDGTVTVKVKQQSHIADASASHSITDPADTPASADALRDDLVANAIPDIEAALNALGAKVNAILAALETAEIFST